MAKQLNDVMAALPVARRAKIERRVHELAFLNDLRRAATLDAVTRFASAHNCHADISGGYPFRR